MTKIKICGLMDQEMVEATCQLGADYLGFIFAKSKREMLPREVKRITKNVPEQIKKVGVFVSPTEEEVKRVIQESELDLVQIHGDFCMKEYGVPVIQAKSVEQSITIQTTADFLLLDAPPKEFYGGNGETFSWEEINPSELPKEKLIIAGGLTSQNVQQALAYFQPMGVDVSSGVETDGKKDRQKIQAFIEKVKEYDYVSTTR